jgi:hypothetical protein
LGVVVGAFLAFWPAPVASSLPSAFWTVKQASRTLGFDHNGQVLLTSKKAATFARPHTQIDSAVRIANDIFRSHIDQFFDSKNLHLQSDSSFADSNDHAGNALQPPADHGS